MYDHCIYALIAMIIPYLFFFIYINLLHFYETKNTDRVLLTEDILAMNDLFYQN